MPPPVSAPLLLLTVHNWGHEINSLTLQTSWKYLEKNDSLSISLSLSLLEAVLSYRIVQVVPFFTGSEIQIGDSAELLRE